MAVQMPYTCALAFLPSVELSQPDELLLQMSELPFRPAGVNNKHIDGLGYEYAIEGQQTTQKSGKLEVPFRPTHPNKSGFQGTLNKFPEYLAGASPMRGFQILVHQCIQDNCRYLVLL
jgi:hypothetical protein